MTITTLAAAIEGLRPSYPIIKSIPGNHSIGVFGTLWNLSPQPPLGSYDATLDGVALTAPVTGAIPWTDPDGSNRAYLGRLEITPSRADIGVVVPAILADRLWHNGGIDVTSTSAQSITSPTWPARDEVGQANGRGVFLALEVSAAMGAATPTITVEYTNSDGVAGRTGTNIFPAPSSAAAETTLLISLQAGDRGVRSVQSITLSASWLSGTINLVAFRPVFYAVDTATVTSSVYDVITACMPELYDGSVLYVMWHNRSTSNAGAILGSFQPTWG